MRLTAYLELAMRSSRLQNERMAAAAREPVRWDFCRQMDSLDCAARATAARAARRKRIRKRMVVTFALSQEKCCVRNTEVLVASWVLHYLSVHG